MGYVVVFFFGGYFRIFVALIPPMRIVPTSNKPVRHWTRMAEGADKATINTKDLTFPLKSDFDFLVDLRFVVLTLS